MRLCRASERFTSISEGSEETETTVDGEASSATNTKPTNTISSPRVRYEDGLLRILNQSEIEVLSVLTEELVTHLIYGEGYNGLESSEGIPDELVIILRKTLDLQTLELRGFWNFTNVPTDYFGYLAHFPRLKQLNKLVLPRSGLFLDRMGGILVGIFGLQLESLECSAEFLEGSIPKDIFGLLPKIKHLRIFDTSVKVVRALLEMPWKLESLNLGQFRITDSEFVFGIPVTMLEKVAFLFGLGLAKFSYLFPVIDENEKVMDDVKVQLVIKQYMPTADIQVT